MIKITVNLLGKFTFLDKVHGGLASFSNIPIQMINTTNMGMTTRPSNKALFIAKFSLYSDSSMSSPPSCGGGGENRTWP